MPDEVIAVPSASLTLRRPLEDVARAYVRASKSENALRAYRSDLRDFGAWCADQAVAPLPATPQTVSLYISALAEQNVKPSTIQRRLSAISLAHQLAGHTSSPTGDWLMRTTMQGVRRTLGTAPTQKTPVVTAELRRLLATCPDDTLAGLRDRALLVVGFADGFRRSELVALDVTDLKESSDGSRITVRQSERGWTSRAMLGIRCVRD